MRTRTYDSPFTACITDLMSSLAVIFVMLLVFFIADQQIATIKSEAPVVKAMKIKPIPKETTLEQQMERFKTKRKELLVALRKNGIPASEDPDDALAISYQANGSKLQFETNKASLKPDGQYFLRSFIPALAAVVTNPRFSSHIQSILIEGHTDHFEKVEGRNLQLSQERSLEVLKYALNWCLEGAERDDFLRLASISGKGKRDLLPKGSKDGFEDPGLSRRVEFIIRLKSITPSMQPAH